MKIFLTTFLLMAIIALFCSVVFADIPPAAIRTQDKSVICDPNIKTGSLRDVTEADKNAIYKRDGIKANHQGICNGPRGCEVDHRIPLWNGGSNDYSNLIVKPFFGKCNMTQKDNFEKRIHKVICDGKLSVQDAQELLYNHWQDGYKIYINNKDC